MHDYWPYIAAFLSPVLGFLSAYVVLRLNRRYADGQKQREGEDSWRKSRLDAEQALRDELKRETAARTQWQLENDGDLERIAGILKDVNETQKLTAALAATSQHHGGELTRINNRVEDVSRQLTQFVMNHAKYS